MAANAVEGALHADRQRAGQGDPADYYAQVDSYFRSLPPDRFPTTAALAPQLAAGTGDERFAFGLSLIVSGLAARATPPQRPD